VTHFSGGTAGDAASNAHVGGEAPPKASKQPFFFGNPEDFSMEELAAGTRSQWSAFKNDVKGFTAAIEWGEPLIFALAVFHIFILFVALLIRKHNELQIVFFCTIMGLVYGAEHINRLAGAHWEKFSTQNYFDTRGVFISTMFSTPLLLVGMVSHSPFLAYTLTPIFLTVAPVNRDNFVPLAWRVRSCCCLACQWSSVVSSRASTPRVGSP